MGKKPKQKRAIASEGALIAKDVIENKDHKKDNKPKFDVFKNNSKNMEIIEKMEAAAKNQRKQLENLESLRDRWKEAIEVPSMIEGCHKEIEVAEKDLEVLKGTLKDIEGKSREEQKDSLLLNEEFLQKHEDIKLLAQKNLTRTQQKWYKEHYNLIPKYQAIMNYTREKREKFINKQIKPIEKSFYVKIDINSFYNSLPEIIINMDQPTSYREVGSKAKTALEKLENDKTKEQGKSEEEIKKERKQGVDEIIGEMRMNAYGNLVIKKLEKKERKKLAQDFEDIKCGNREEIQEYTRNIMEEIKSVREFSKIKDGFKDMNDINEKISGYANRVKDLENNINMLEEAIQYTKSVIESTSEENKATKIEEDYEMFKRKYAINENPEEGLSDEIRAERLPWFEEAGALYEKLIAKEKSSENTEINMNDIVKNAEIRKMGIICYKYAISYKNKPIEENSKKSMVEYIISKKDIIRGKNMKDNEEYEKANELFRLLEKEQGIHKKIKSSFKDVISNVEKWENYYSERCERDPAAKRAYEKLVKTSIKGSMDQFKEMVRADFIFAKIINVCEAQQNEFSDALEKLVCQQEETIASKREQIDHLQHSLDKSPIEIKDFIQQSRPEAASVKESSTVAPWLDEGHSLFEEAESTKKQDAIEPWLELGHTLLTQELAETQKELERQKEGLQTTPDVSAPTDTNTSHLTTLLASGIDRERGKDGY